MLFDPEVNVEDSVTYDITAWSVPLAYNLDASASKSTISASPGFERAESTQLSAADVTGAYAVVVPWSDVSSAAVLADLAAANVQVRTAGNDISFGQQEYPAGSLVVTRADNRKVADYAATVKRILDDRGVAGKVLSTGFSVSGGDLGSSNYGLVDKMNVAVLGGDGVNSNQFGQVWWYFEQELRHPVSIFYPEDVSDVFAGDYDVLIMPSGRYKLKEQVAELTEWVRGGGKLIAIGGANASLAGLEGFDLKKKKEEEESDSTNVEDQLLPYAGRERRFISTYNPGSVVTVEMDATHPLAFGIGESYHSLKTGSDAYAYLDGGQNAGRIRQEPTISGFMGAEVKEAIRETLAFGVQDMGAGQVIYLIDNPLYRGFWEEGKLLFSNALFQVR